MGSGYLFLIMFVSVITATYNRARFMKRLIHAFEAQTYRQDLMEWIILDDGFEEVGEYFAGIPNVRYIRSHIREPMGEKLNRLCKEAKGDIIIVMDDDDYYPPERVSTVVDAFYSNPQIEVAGSSHVYMYSTGEDQVYSVGPYHSKHALNCTLAFRKSYLKEHRYDPTEVCAVEKVFLEDFTVPMIQLPAENTILHIIHSSNTFKKKMNIGMLHKTDLQLEDVIRDEELRAAYIDAF